MPLEIRELVIKTTVNRDRAQLPSRHGASAPLRKEDRAALVAACVEQVLAVLDARAER